jgi:two-component system sensor histidine kinase DesK
MWKHFGDALRATKENITSEAERKPIDEVIAESGVTFRLWRLYQHFWLICLLFPLISLMMRPLPLWHLLGGLLALLFLAISYTWIMWPHPVNQRKQTAIRFRLSLLLFFLLVLQVTTLSLLDGSAWLWLFIGVSAIAGVILPMREAGIAVVFLTLFPLILILITQRNIAEIDWWWLIALMLLVRGLGLDMIGVARLGSAIRTVHTTRRELARLKVEEERMRMARDLHDLLGQALSMITLKAELAQHLVTEEPDRCVQELSEIEQVARNTLREVREAVAGYRQPRLESELEGARQLLSAAGIEAQIDSVGNELPRAYDAVLAWTIREGVTNIIRHNHHARQCRIHLIQRDHLVVVEILSDGYESSQEEKTEHQGFGLAGLRERVSLLEGNVQASPLTLSGKAYFRLAVELPMKATTPPQRLREERK